MANKEKKTAGVKIIVTIVEDYASITKNDIWFGGKHHCANYPTEISTDTLCATCYHWGHIILQCPNMECPRYQLCSGQDVTKNYK